MAVAVDTSALLGVVFGEPDAAHVVERLLAHAGECLISAVTLVEASIVVEARQGPGALQDLRLLLDRIGADVVAVDSDTASIALAAWRRFGKGRHPAGLNLGDCFSYALAKIHGVPLLFKGTDFAQTDIAHVV